MRTEPRYSWLRLEPTDPVQSVTMPVMVLGKGRWSLIERHVSRVVRAVKASKPGNDTEVDIPYE